MKQRILFLDQQSWRGGAQRVLEEVLDALKGEFVPLVAFPEDGPLLFQLRQRDIETLTYSLGRYRAGQKSLSETISLAARTLYCGFHLARRIIQQNVRLVYINGPRCLPSGVLAARMTGRPSLFHLHLILTRKTDIILTARAAQYVNRILACSAAAAEPLLSANPQLTSVTRVVYNPALNQQSVRPLAPLTSTPGVRFRPSARHVVGMVGRITAAKGQHLLLRAAAQLRGPLRDLQLIFVGAPAPGSREDASYRHFLEAEARALGLEAMVLWAGYQADLGPYYSAFDVLLLPSTVSEALPLVAMEAMQWGVPVIASRIGGIPEIVRHGVNGLLFPPGDERALAKSLERILRDPALRARLGAGARASVDERFSRENFRSTIRRIVSELSAPVQTRETKRRAEEITART